MGLIVGVDGGGTSTRCAVSDGEKILGRGVSGGCNIVRLGEAAARESIQSAIRQAFAATRMGTESAESACIGVAGHSVAQVRMTVLAIVREMLACPVEVVGDQEIAFEAAFGDGPGILVIAGTGSIAFGRSPDGRTAKAGGYGFVVSDEGSGQWIGRTAVSSCLRALDAGVECGLMPMLLDAFRVATVGELIQAVNKMPPPNFSELIPVVMKASEVGDAIAIEILKKAGWELAGLARLTKAKLGMGEHELRVAMAGGVFEHCALVRDEFESLLRDSYPKAEIIRGVAEPLLGALARAKKQQTLLDGHTANEGS